ncbi:hypothetical protein T12_12804, partial [Trichinella patagoniensis]
LKTLEQTVHTCMLCVRSSVGALLFVLRVLVATALIPGLPWVSSAFSEAVRDISGKRGDSGMFPHAVLVLNRMFSRAGGISLISECAQFRVTTATLSAVSSNNGWQMPKLFKGADAAFDVWRLLLSIVVQTKGTMLTSGHSAGVLFNKGGADLLSAAVALLMVNLVTILLFSRASLFDIDLSLLLRTAVWDTDGFLDVPGFLRVFAHLITEPREHTLSKRANHARERSRVGNFRVVPLPQLALPSGWLFLNFWHISHVVSCPLIFFGLLPSLGTQGRMYEGATPVFRQGLLTFSPSFFGDINRAALIAEGLPTIDSTCSTEPKSTPCLQRAMCSLTSQYMVLYRGALRKEGGAVSSGLLTQSYCRTTIYQIVEDSELYDGLWERPEAFIECG